MSNTTYENLMTTIKNKNLEQTITSITTNKITKVDDERKQFLESRPWRKDIHSKFQLFLDKIFPGTFLVSFPSDDSVNSLKLVDSIFVPKKTNNLIEKIMASSMCHDNCELLKIIDKTLVIYTGYGLSDDGLWRNHSWLIDKNNNIIETTEERLIYIGYALK